MTDFHLSETGGATDFRRDFSSQKLFGLVDPTPSKCIKHIAKTRDSLKLELMDLYSNKGVKPSSDAPLSPFSRNNKRISDKHRGLLEDFNEDIINNRIQHKPKKQNKNKTNKNKQTNKQTNKNKQTKTKQNKNKKL